MKPMIAAALLLATARAADIARTVGPYTVTVGEDTIDQVTRLSAASDTVTCTGTDKLLLGVSRFTKDATPQGYSPFMPTATALNEDGISATGQFLAGGDPVLVTRSNAQLRHWHIHAACARHNTADDTYTLGDHHSAPFNEAAEALGATVPLYSVGGRTVAWLHRAQDDTSSATVLMPLGMDLGDLRIFDGVTSNAQLSVRAMGSDALQGPCTAVLPTAGLTLPGVLPDDTAEVLYNVDAANARLGVLALETTMRAGELTGRTLVFTGRGADARERSVCVPLSAEGVREYRTEENSRVAVASGASGTTSFAAVVEERRQGSGWGAASLWLAVDSADDTAYSYHVHVGRPGPVTMPAACDAAYTGGHLDPTFKGMQSVEEVGNLSGRHGPATRAAVVRGSDGAVTLAKDAVHSLLGRSLVLHEASSGARRLCGALISSQDAALGINDRNAVNILRNVPHANAVANFEVAQAGSATTPYVSVKLNEPGARAGAWVSGFTLDTPAQCSAYGGYLAGYDRVQAGAALSGVLSSELHVAANEARVDGDDLAAREGQTVVMESISASGVAARSCVVIGDGARVPVPAGLPVDEAVAMVELSKLRGKLSGAEVRQLRDAVLAAARTVASGAEVQAAVASQAVGVVEEESAQKAKVSVVVRVRGVAPETLQPAVAASTDVAALLAVDAVKPGTQLGRCRDGKANGGETGVDCGGSAGCGQCGEGAGCVASRDCLVGACVGGKCSEGNSGAVSVLHAGVAVAMAIAVGFMAF